MHDDIINKKMTSSCTLAHSHAPETEPRRTLCLPYVRRLTERIEKVCNLMRIRSVFKAATTLQKSHVHVKKLNPPEKKVYEVPCKNCSMTYIGGTGRTLKKRLTEHKYAVRKGDTENGIAVHANTNLLGGSHGTG